MSTTLKVGCTVKVIEKPNSWSSRCNINCPLNLPSYNYPFIGQVTAVGDAGDHTAFEMGGYGWTYDERFMEIVNEVTKQTSLVGRYLKTLKDRPHGTPYSVGQYVLITHDNLAGTVTCEQGYDFGSGKYDFTVNYVELMPEGFTPNKSIPEKWCIKTTPETRGVVNDFLNKNGYSGKLHRDYYCHFPLIDSGSAWSHIKKGYTEITFEQFKQHVLKETSKSETMFRAGDYIVLLDGPKKDPDFKLFYCYKQRENSICISSEIDCRGSKSNGWGLHSFDKSENNDWRYATPEEIAEYDRLGKPFDVTTMNMKTTSINMKAIQEEAKRRFPIGCRFRCTNGDEYTLVDDVVVYKIMNNMIYASDGLGCLYKDGQWATLTGVINTSGFNNVGYVDTSVKYSTCLATTDHTIRVSDSEPSIKAPTSTPLLLNKTKQTKQLVNLK